MGILRLSPSAMKDLPGKVRWLVAEESSNDNDVEMSLKSHIESGREILARVSGVYRASVLPSQILERYTPERVLAKFGFWCMSFSVLPGEFLEIYTPESLGFLESDFE